DLWDNWLQCVPRPEGLEAVGVAMKDLVKTLRQLVEGGVMAYATAHFGTNALAALAPGRAVLKQRLEPLDHWVTAAAELDALTDGVMNDLKMPFKDRSDAAWVDTRRK